MLSQNHKSDVVWPNDLLLYSKRWLSMKGVQRYVCRLQVDVSFIR